MIRGLRSCERARGDKKHQDQGKGGRCASVAWQQALNATPTPCCP